MSEKAYETVLKEMLKQKEIIDAAIKEGDMGAEGVGFALSITQNVIQAEQLKQLTRIADAVEGMVVSKQERFEGKATYSAVQRGRMVKTLEEPTTNTNWKEVFTDCHIPCGTHYDDAKRKCPCGEYKGEQKPNIDKTDKDTARLYNEVIKANKEAADSPQDANHIKATKKALKASIEKGGKVGITQGTQIK